jgi:hypothetical protein
MKCNLKILFVVFLMTIRVKTEVIIKILKKFHFVHARLHLISIYQHLCKHEDSNY